MRRRNKTVSAFWGGSKPPQKEVFETFYFGALPCLKNLDRRVEKPWAVQTKTDGKKSLSFLSHAAFHAEPVHFLRFKQTLKERFRQIDLWIVSHEIRIT